MSETEPLEAGRASLLVALKELWEVTEDACDAGFGFQPFQSQALSNARRHAEEAIRDAHD